MAEGTKDLIRYRTWRYPVWMRKMEGWEVRVSLEDIEANGIGDEEEDENDDEEDPEEETDDESREYVSDLVADG